MDRQCANVGRPALGGSSVSTREEEDHRCLRLMDYTSYLGACRPTVGLTLVCSANV